MTSVKAALLVIWLSLLSHGHPLLDFCETFAVVLDMSKAFGREWHETLISNYPPTASILPSATSSQVSFLIALLLLW